QSIIWAYMTGPIPPSCVHKCRKCKPCKRVQVAVPPSMVAAFTSGAATQDYYGVVWKCMCRGKLYKP
ncbi:hypothetical protein MIMGU_mgv1a018982mg, partial [Erythranthe guttata]